MARRHAESRPGAHGRWTLEVRFLGLQIEACHDGLLRGNPEPVILDSGFLAAMPSSAPLTFCRGHP